MMVVEGGGGECPTPYKNGVEIVRETVREYIRGMCPGKVFGSQNFELNFALFWPF